MGSFQYFSILECFRSGFSNTIDLKSQENTLWKVDESGYESEIILRETLDW